MHAPMSQPLPNNMFVFDTAQKLFQINAQVNNQSGGRRVAQISRSGLQPLKRPGKAQDNADYYFIKDFDSFIAGVIVLLIIQSFVVVMVASIVMCCHVTRRGRYSNYAQQDDTKDYRKFND